MSFKQPKILIVEDEPDIISLISYNLKKELYSVSSIENGQEVLNKALVEKPDLILLDVMLPGVDGLTVCRQLKENIKTQKMPIIMLTAKGEESDIVLGLELGADDYVTKPFKPKELIARVRTVLRRYKSSQEKEEISEFIEYGNLTVNLNSRVVEMVNETSGNQKQKIDLTSSEYNLLIMLLKRPGWVFTRNQIIDEIRGADVAITTRAIDVVVVSLRKKLIEFSDYIQTVRGVGYRLKEI